jgi:hypothetical protein
MICKRGETWPPPPALPSRGRMPVRVSSGQAKGGTPASPGKNRTAGVKTPFRWGRRVAGVKTPAYRSRPASIPASQVSKRDLEHPAVRRFKDRAP